MKLKNLKSIKDPVIALEKFNFSDAITEKLDYEKWIDYVEQHKDYYTWLEDSDKGKNRLANIDRIPEDFRSGILEQLNKSQVFAEFNEKKGWHEIVIDFHKDTGVVKTTFMKKITKEHLKRLLEMANYLDAYLLNSGKTIIDEKVIEELE